MAWKDVKRGAVVSEQVLPGKWYGVVGGILGALTALRAPRYPSVEEPMQAAFEASEGGHPMNPDLSATALTIAGAAGVTYALRLGKIRG